MSEGSVPIGPLELNLWIGDKVYEALQVRDTPEHHVEIVLKVSCLELEAINFPLVTFQLNDFYVECPIHSIDRKHKFTTVRLDMTKCVPVDQPEILRIPEDHELDLDKELYG